MMMALPRLAAAAVAATAAATAAVVLYDSAGLTVDAAVAPTGFRALDIGVGCILANHQSEHHKQRLQRSPGDVLVELQRPGAQSLALHFSHAQLPPGAMVAVVDMRAATHLSDEEKRRESSNWVLLRYDRESIPVAPFVTPPIFSTHIGIRYTAGNSNSTGNATSTNSSDAYQSHATSSDDDCFGFHIDELRFVKKSANRPSFHRSKAASATGSGDNCASVEDAAMDAPCVAFDAAVIEASRPVARLLIQKSPGAIFCTGWLLGCEGHILSNHHCVTVEHENDSNAVAIEFMAQGTTCGQPCDAPSLCPGCTVALLADIVAFSPETELDYVLFRPRLSPAQLQALVANYGFLSLREGGPVLGEQIFIPQHPGGFGKRIALKHAGSYGRVTSLNETSCNARSDNLGYLMDTQGGSSGAPVVASDDMSVIGLHFCGGCPNSAIPSQEIVRSLIAANVLPACAISELQWPAATPQW